MEDDFDYGEEDLVERHPDRYEASGNLVPLVCWAGLLCLWLLGIHVVHDLTELFVLGYILILLYIIMALVTATILDGTRARLTTTDMLTGSIFWFFTLPLLGAWWIVRKTFNLERRDI